MKCPRCATVVEGIPGAMAVCGNCGFRAHLPLPAAPPASSVRQPPAPRPPVSTPAPAARLGASGVMAVWAYVLGLAALATFFLARFGLPFAFGLAAVVLGVLAKRRDRADRRALFGALVGAAGIIAGVAWLLTMA